jgi:type III secretion system low calcium response chaperone LcrH/SycD
MSTNIKIEELEKMDIAQLQALIQRIDVKKGGKEAEGQLQLAMEYAMKKEIMPKTALKISDETMEAIYSQAYALYNQGKYKEASYVFRFLMLLDLSTSKYVLGIAACLHRMKDFANAANLYFLAAALDPENPIPHYHATDCYIQLGFPALAIIALQMAINTCGDKPQYQVLKERAKLLQSGLKQQIDEKSNEAEPKQESKK